MLDEKLLAAYKKEAGDELLNMHISMFEYTGLPDTVDPFYIEKYLQTPEPDAFIGWWKLPGAFASPGFNEGSLIVSRANFGTDLNPYGEGTEVICVTANGHERKFKNRYEDDIVVGFNNLIKTGVNDLDTTSQMIADIDLSLEYLIFYTRLYPIYRVQDEKQRDKIKHAFKNMALGVPMTIQDQNLLEELGVESSGIKMDLLTSPELSRTIQYTAKLREDVKRWHYLKYGQSINSTTKLAQETTDEVNNAMSSSLILPLSMLKARRNMIEEVNRKFGTNITVDFSPSWRAEVTRYETISGEDEIDGTESTNESEVLTDDQTDDRTDITGSDVNK